MLSKATKEITAISDKDSINSENYLESLNYIDNLYFFINKLKMAISLDQIVFLPTFKGANTCGRYAIESNEKENSLKFFSIEYPEFIEDKEKIEKNLSDVLGSDCEKIEYSGDIISFTLK